MIPAMFLDHLRIIAHYPDGHVVIIIPIERLEDIIVFDKHSHVMC